MDSRTMGTIPAATPGFPSVQWHPFSQNTQELDMILAQDRTAVQADTAEVLTPAAAETMLILSTGPSRPEPQLDPACEEADSSYATAEEGIPSGRYSSVSKADAATQPSLGQLTVTTSVVPSPEDGAYAFPDSPVEGTRPSASLGPPASPKLEPKAPQAADQVSLRTIGSKEQERMQDQVQQVTEAAVESSPEASASYTAPISAPPLPPKIQQPDVAASSEIDAETPALQPALNTSSSPAAKLEVYRASVKELMAVKQAKPDMVAYKQLRGQLTKEGQIGHIPGIPVGFEVYGKGELAILGIHCDITKGIYSKGTSPAFAIALSGGYADDNDTGETCDYTGMGGQKKGIQVEDQRWETSGNLALKRSFEQQLPVRVVRRKVEGKGSKSGMPVYLYEGLYRVAEARMEQGIHGKKVCKFRMEAVPGESKVSLKVISRVRHFKKVNLAVRTEGSRAGNEASSSSAPAKKRRLPQPSKPGGQKAKVARLVVQPVKPAQAAPAKDVKLLDDFSEGVERIRIPVYGRSPDDLKSLPEKFTYVRASVMDPGAPERMDAWGRAAFEWKDGCGIEAMGGKSYLTDRGLLTETLEWGLFECCEGCIAKQCKASRVVSKGISLPVQIFKTRHAGWGVRCASLIPIGAFVCEYSGAIMTDTEAENCSGEYLFDMDHFWAMHNVAGKSPAVESPGKLIPKLPLLSKEHDLTRDVHLSIDAASCGNIGRFINHSCNGNLVVQTVFTQGSTALNYHVAFFAQRDIPAGTELTYDYMWRPTQNTARELWCKCGEPNCVGRLL